MTASIRFATINDIPAIHQMAHDIWPYTYGTILSNEQLAYMLQLFYSKESLTQQMNVKKHIFLIAETPEMPVGYASYAPHEDEPFIFHLHKLYVLPNHQKKNIGKALLDFILKDLCKRGATALHLNVNRNNSARYFYEKIGFKILKEEDIPIGNGYFMNDYVMGLKL